MMEDGSRPDRVDTNEYDVHTQVLPDGTVLVDATIEGMSLRVGVALGRDKAALRIAAPEDHMTLGEGTTIGRVPRTNSEANSMETFRHVTVRLKDHCPHTGERLLGALRAVVLEGERALSNQVKPTND